VAHGTNSGEMIMSVTIPDADIFVFQYKLNSSLDDAWFTIARSSPDWVAKGLKPISLYDFRCIGAANKNQTEETGVITKPAA
jgi:hypothetical protein